MSADLHPEDLARFRALIVHHLGLEFGESKQEFLAGVLRQRLAARGASGAVYLQELASAPHAEMRALASELTVSETYFFRNPNQFRALAELALPARLRARGSGRGLRLLSAGCASGEETYSLAMTVRELIPAAELGELCLQGVDLNPAMIAKARRGRYTAWSLRETSPALRARYFTDEGAEYALAPEIRAMASFEEDNVSLAGADFWRGGGYDLIFCRNLLMYFAPEVMRAVVERLAGALVPGGFLYLGHAETLRGLSHDFHLCHSHDSFYYQKKGDVATRPAAAAAWAPPVAAATTLPWVDTSWVDVIQAASERIQRLASPSEAVPTARPAATEPREREWEEAFALLRHEKFREALHVLEAAPPGAAADPDALLLRAVLLMNCGEIAAAEALCAQLLAEDDQQAGAHHVIALCREHAADLEGAVLHDHLAAHLDPGFAIPHLHLGRLARRGGDRPTAIRELRQAERLLQGEDAARVLLFGGGFGREALLAFVGTQLVAMEMEGAA